MRKIPLLQVLSAAFLTLYGAEASALGWFGYTLDGRVCDGRGQGFGPYDYLAINEPSDPLYEEGRYWEIDVVHTDRARRAMDTSGPGKPLTQGEFQVAIGNLDYTLRAVPNDPRALRYMIELEGIRRSNKTPLETHHPPPECYFQRAIKFRPELAYIRALFGIYLHKRGRYELAVEQYKEALRLDSSNAEVHYNLGLVLTKVRRHKEAVSHAEEAYRLGYPLPGLKNILRKHGYELQNME